MVQEARTTLVYAQLGDLLGQVVQVLKIDGLLSGVLADLLVLKMYPTRLLILILVRAATICIIIVSLILFHT